MYCMHCISHHIGITTHIKIMIQSINMNKLLCVSSCGMFGTMILSSIYTHNKGLLLFYLLGTITSIWNHGTNSKISMYIDRGYMVIGFFIDSWLLSKSESNIFILYIFYLSVLSFTSYKVYYHILSHLYITICHVLQLRINRVFIL